MCASRHARLVRQPGRSQASPLERRRFSEADWLTILGRQGAHARSEARTLSADSRCYAARFCGRQHLYEQRSHGAQCAVAPIPPRGRIRAWRSGRSRSARPRRRGTHASPASRPIRPPHSRQTSVATRSSSSDGAARAAVSRIEGSVPQCPVTRVAPPRSGVRLAPWRTATRSASSSTAASSSSTRTT